MAETSDGITERDSDWVHIDTAVEGAEDHQNYLELTEASMKELSRIYGTPEDCLRREVGTEDGRRVVRIYELCPAEECEVGVL